MAVVTGTVHSVHTLSGRAVSDVEVAEILFNLSGTYAGGDNAELPLLAQAIQDSRRNGKTVTIRGAMMGRPGTSAVDNSDMTLKGVAVSGVGADAKATFELAGADFTTEQGAGAVPALNRPFSLIVTFTEDP